MNKILEGDCFDLLNTVQDGSVDMILTDPPYGIANEVKITRSRNSQKFGKAKTITHDFGEWDKFGGFEDFMNFTQRWVDLCVPKLRGGGMLVSFFDKDRIIRLHNFERLLCWVLSPFVSAANRQNHIIGLLSALIIKS